MAMAGMVGASPVGDTPKFCLSRRPSKSQPLSSSSTLRIMSTAFRPISLRITPSPHLPVAMASNSFRRLQPICLAKGGGEGEWEKQNQSQGSPWKFLENAFGRFKKELTVQDMLRARKEKNPEELDYGGGQGLPPQGGGGGGGDGTGGQGDQDPWDDLFQTTMATIGFIFVYFYILNGELLMKLARDYIIYLFGGKKSIRLAESMESWKDFVEETSVEKVTNDPQGLARVILSTPTWWYKPLDDDEDEEDDEDDKNDRNNTDYDSE